MLATSGEVLVACGLDEAWALFNRFDEVATLIPTLKSIEFRGDEIWATMGVQLGVISVTSKVMLQVVHISPWRITAEGWSFLGETIHTQINRNGPEGIEKDAKGKITIHLELEAVNGVGVLVKYAAEVDAYGRLKRIYQSILKSKAPAMMEQFAEKLRCALDIGVDISLGSLEGAPL
jgi:carbon monoxide dehydrogenase subunit G